MRRRAIFSFIAACTLSACAHGVMPQASNLDGMRWIEVDDDDPKLAFGVPNSDVMVLMMTCAPRSGEVAIAVFGDPGGARAVTLRSGDTSQRLAARRGGSALHEGIVETATPAASPLMVSFARTGDLAVGVSASPMALPAADRATAGRFVSRCRA